MNKIFKYFFGSDTSSFEPNFEFITKVMNIIGCRIYDDRKLTIFQNIHFYSFYACGICTVISALKLGITERDLDLQIQAFITFLMGTEIIIKVGCMWFNATYQKQLHQVAIQHTKLLDNLGHDALKIGISGRKFVNWSSGALTFMYFISLGIFNIYSYLSPREWPLPLYFKIVGIPHTSQPGYTINYIYVCLEIIYASVGMSAFDASFILYSSYVSTRFDLLKIYFSQLGRKSGIFNSDEKQHELIRFTTRMHIELQKFVKKFNEIYSFAVLIHTVFTTGLICICFVHMHVNLFANSYNLLCNLILEMYLYSYCGQLIVTKNQEAADALYSSNWYELNSCEDKKDILLILTNIQHELALSVGGFTTLEMTTFTDVMKSAYRICTVIKNTF
ncbi:odorant receptor 22c-like [Hermetia illucens]|uniref:odorant receptor 22c-like n=1 Tax=Hermetia illucens TaxID=343691 RepID=UPI0018CC7519|nr:odorant receptor 22c-like [Hermetia illucens]